MPFKVALLGSFRQGRAASIAPANQRDHLGSGQQIVALEPHQGPLSKLNSVAKGKVRILLGISEADEELAGPMVVRRLKEAAPAPRVGDDAQGPVVPHNVANSD